MSYIEVIVDDHWKLTRINPEAFAKCRTGAEPWIGELSVRPTFTTAQIANCDDWLDVARLSAARFFTSYGFVVGEAPRIDGDPEQRPHGIVRVRCTALVTVPPYWTGPPETLGQRSLWDVP